MRTSRSGELGGFLHVGISLVSQAADQTTGARNIIREVVLEMGRRPAEIEVELLCNQHAMESMANTARPNVRLIRADSLSFGQSRGGRAIAVAHARAFPGRMARQFSRSTQVTHYPMNFIVPPRPGPAVVVIHDVQHYDLPQNFSRLQLAWRNYFYRVAANKATMLITDSEHARLRTIEMFGLDPDRVRGVHVAVDHARFVPADAPGDAEQLAGLRLPQRYLLYPASFWPHKNHLGLLEAIGQVADEEIHLVLTGSPMGRQEEIMAAAARHGLAERVHHLGIVPDEAVPALYRHAIGLVFPSTYEGFGMPTVEAMACGCPVASSLVTSLREVCGDAVIELTPGDPTQMARAIERLIGNQQLRSVLREKGFAQARRFTWSRCVDEHLEVFRRAIEIAA
ncbi:MAG: glycosyltransferase family 4 protein [Solirubrobacteraceae bacterium]